MGEQQKKQKKEQKPKLKVKKSGVDLGFISEDFFAVVEFALKESEWEEDSIPAVERALEMLDQLKLVWQKQTPQDKEGKKKLSLPDQIKKAAQEEIPEAVQAQIDAAIAAAKGSPKTADEFARQRGVEIIETDPEADDGIPDLSPAKKIEIMEKMGIDHGNPMTPGASNV